MHRLPDSARAPEHLAADPADTTLAALRNRLRNLAPNHASAIPRENRRPDHAGLRDFDTLTRQFWDQTDRLRSAWTNHLQRWPRPAVRERLRPDDPPGSWRGPGDRTLDADENARADQVIDALQECEPTVTGFLQQLESQSPFGARLVGLEHCLKGPGRLKEKLADALRAEDVADVVEASSDVFDAVRYTYCFDVDQYSKGYADMHERLESAGYHMIFRANRWVGDPEYRGINSRWLTPDGDRFEVQFHTPESFFAKEFLTHEAYDRLRSPEASDTERAKLKEFQQSVCSTIPEPDQVTDILDVRPR